MPRAAAALPPVCLDLLRDCDAIVHAGDHSEIGLLEMLRALGPPVVAVHGNVDSDDVRRALPSEARLDAGGLRIAVTHDAGPERGRAARMARRFPEADGVIFGHSHIPLHEVPPSGPWLLNPGSPTDRRRQPHHTMAILRIGDGAASAELVIVDGAEARQLPDALVRGRGDRAE